MSSFFKVIAIRPEVQKRAQAEIESVCGKNKLPTWEDRKNLPFVEAIYTEVLRWHPVIPGIAHASTEDQEYMGYQIPKGSMLYSCIW